MICRSLVALLGFVDRLTIAAAHCVLIAACYPHSTSSQYAWRETSESSSAEEPAEEGLLLGVGEQAGSWVDPQQAVVPTGCPQDCSGHGICDVTVCVCFDGYTGSACESISETETVSVPSPSPVMPATPAPAGARPEERDGEEQPGTDGGEGACPPLTAPGMAGVRCYGRVHPELVPLGIGGGSCFCFIMLLGCAANRGRQRRLGLRGDEGGGYSPTGRNSLSDASFGDRSRSRRKSRSPYGLDP